METFKDRLIDEKTELSKKIEKLKVFLGSEKIKEISPIQNSFLWIQFNAMLTYLSCLEKRIEWLDNDNE